MKHLFQSNLLKTIIVSASISVALIACGSNSEQTATNTATPVAASPDGIGKYTSANVKVSATVDEQEAAKGLSIFNSKCVACHKLTDQRVVGPGLKGVTKIRTAAWIFNMLNNSEEMQKQDPEAKKLLEQYMTPMPPQNLTDEELVAIYNLLKKNE